MNGNKLLANTYSVIGKHLPIQYTQLNCVGFCPIMTSLTTSYDVNDDFVVNVHCAFIIFSCRCYFVIALLLTTKKRGQRQIQMQINQSIYSIYLLMHLSNLSMYDDEIAANTVYATVQQTPQPESNVSAVVA